MCKSNTAHLPNHPTHRIPDDNVDLLIWGNLECSASIIGASIPFLRVLVRDIRSSGRHGYYLPSLGAVHHSEARTHCGAGASAEAWARRGWARDNESDRSILPTAPPAGKIVMTSEVVVDYEGWGKADNAGGHEV